MEKNKTTAGLLALFLGNLGAHKFYMGKNVQAVLYLLFFWTLIPGIIAFVEALTYFFGSEQSFQKKVRT